METLIRSSSIPVKKKLHRVISQAEISSTFNNPEFILPKYFTVWNQAFNTVLYPLGTGILLSNLPAWLDLPPGSHLVSVLFQV